MPRVTKNGALAWAIALSVFAFLLFIWNVVACGAIFLIIAGVFWLVWAMKFNRDHELAAHGVTATLPPTAQARLTATKTQLTIEAGPPMHSKGSGRYYVPPALE